MYNRAKVVFFSGIEKRLSHKVADKYQKNISPTHTTEQITPQTPTLVTLKPAQYHTISGVISNKKQPKFRAKQQRKTTPFRALKHPISLICLQFRYYPFLDITTTYNTTKPQSLFQPINKIFLTE
jgi:hypothetical protein